MSSSFIGKVDKAKKYAEEKNRVSITTFKATFQGNHGTYDVSFDGGSGTANAGFSGVMRLAATPWPCSGFLTRFWPGGRKPPRKP